MYIETSANYYVHNDFCSFERTDKIEITHISFYYRRFSAGSSKSMGHFRNQLLLADNAQSIRYNITKN